MTHAIALTLPPCAECGMPTNYRTVAGLLKCTSGLCDWFVHVEPQGTTQRECCRECGCTREERCCVHREPQPVPEPLRFSLAAALLAARAAGRL